MTPEREAQVRWEIGGGFFLSNTAARDLLAALDAANAERDTARAQYVTSHAEAKHLRNALDAANADAAQLADAAERAKGYYLGTLLGVGLKPVMDGLDAALAVHRARIEAQPPDEDDPRAADWLNEHQS